jgi:hypothetical protein
MKIKLAFLGIIVSISFVNAQIYTPSGTIQGTSGNNNVGIGTNAPSHLLNVYGSHTDSRILLHSNGAGYDVNQADLMLWASEPGLTYTGVGIGNNIHNFNNVNGGLKLLNTARGGSYIRLLDAAMSFNVVTSGNLDKQALMINTIGNIGIGTSNPNARLDLGSGYGTSGAKFLLYNDDSTSELSGTKCGFYMDNFTYNNLNLVFPEAINVPGLFTISAKNTSGVTLNPYFSIAGITGNVGIGITTPKNKLDVNGTIHSKEVKVDMTGWSDFVFKKQYNLPTLAEVEKHIKGKGHLENIPNEEEVLKNGINLGEMNAKLLQKIEELTLYIIQQEKKNTIQTLEIENSKNEIKILKKENESFKSILERLSQIEQKLK